MQRPTELGRSLRASALSKGLRVPASDGVRSNMDIHEKFNGMVFSET